MYTLTLSGWRGEGGASFLKEWMYYITPHTFLVKLVVRRLSVVYNDDVNLLIMTTYMKVPARELQRNMAKFRLLLEQNPDLEFEITNRRGEVIFYVRRQSGIKPVQQVKRCRQSKMENDDIKPVGNDDVGQKSDESRIDELMASGLLRRGVDKPKHYRPFEESA